MGKTKSKEVTNVELNVNIDKKCAGRLYRMVTEDEHIILPYRHIYDQWMNICDNEGVRPVGGGMASQWDIFGRNECTRIYWTPEGMDYYGYDKSNPPAHHGATAITQMDIDFYWRCKSGEQCQVESGGEI